MMFKPWNKLSMHDKAKYINLAVAEGGEINDISDTYNIYAKGGYLDWLKAVQSWNPELSEDINAQSPTYDYKGFFFDNPEYAWNLLSEESGAHFTDKFKLPNHPTFSDESIYSNDTTKGGKWGKVNNKYVYFPSKYTERNPNRRDYMMNTGEGYAEGNKIYFPFTAEEQVLPEIIIEGNKYKEGGELSFIQKLRDLSEKVLDPKGAAYSIMVSKRGDTSGATRNFNEILYGLANKDRLKAERGNIDRNLASLYIYGNDLNQFEEAPELMDLGVEFDEYLKSVGKDIEDIITYKGDFGTSPLVLPKGSEQDVITYAKSKMNETFFDDNIEYPDSDDVGNFSRRVTVDDKGAPLVVNSDLWDFEPQSYSKVYSSENRDNKNVATQPVAYMQAKALDIVGMPFILKEAQPIEFVDIDEYYDRYNPYDEMANEVSRRIGYLPEVTIYGTK